MLSLSGEGVDSSTLSSLSLSEVEEVPLEDVSSSRTAGSDFVLRGLGAVITTEGLSSLLDLLDGALIGFSSGES